MYFKVAIGNDITTPTITFHEQSGLPFVTALATPAHPTIEMVCPMFWPPGMATGANKLTMKVLHRKCGIVQQGHDCGPAVLHVAAPPYLADVLCVLHTLFSSRKPMFDVQKVRIEGGATAVGTLPLLNCADPTALPSVFAASAPWNSVQVNMTTSDFLRCLVVAGLTAATDILLMKDKGEYGQALKGVVPKVLKESGQFNKKLLWPGAKMLYDKLKGKLNGGDSPREVLTKTLVATATGFISTIGSSELKAGVAVPGNPFYARGGEIVVKDGEVKLSSTTRRGSNEEQVNVEWGKVETKSVNHADNVAKHGHKPWTWGKVIE